MRIAPRTALLLAALGIGSAALGCTGFDLSELPAEPIAFVYRTSEQGRERAERHAAAPPLASRGVARLEGLIDRITQQTTAEVLAETYGQLSLLDPRSGEVTRIAMSGHGARPLEWTPDHAELLFASQRTETPQLYRFTPASQGIRPITRDPPAHAFGSLRADGRLVFTVPERTGRESRIRIFVNQTEGRPPRPISPGPADYDPLWAPDGEYLLFTALAEDGNPSIARVDPQRPEPPRILARDAQEPVFTADGRWIVYSAEIRGGWRLWRMRPDGTGKSPIGQGLVDERHPAVSPNGRFVAYVAIEGAREHLRVRRFDGSGDRPLLDAGDGASPVW